MEHATEVGLDGVYRDPRGPNSPQRAQFVHSLTLEPVMRALFYIELDR